jgi:hypothetical protein
MNKSDLMVQKEGIAKIPASWPSSGIVRITNLSGTTECLAKSAQSTETGVLMVHLNKNFDAAGAKVYTAVPLTAAALVGGNVNLLSEYEVPCIFDEILETGTTVTLASLTIWI